MLLVTIDFEHNLPAAQSSFLQYWDALKLDSSQKSSFSFGGESSLYKNTEVYSTATFVAVKQLINCFEYHTTLAKWLISVGLVLESLQELHNWIILSPFKFEVSGLASASLQFACSVT